MGKWGGGIWRYDGLAVQRLTRKDGLIDDSVQKIFQDSRSDMWIAMEGGATRYRPTVTMPTVHITRVVADRDYGPVEEIELSSAQGYLAFESTGSSSTTHAERMVYVYRLVAYEDEWQWTPEARVVYEELPVGDYTFEIKAVDIDLNYSKPAAVHVRVHPPYERLAWIGTLALAVLLVLWQTGRVVRRDRRLRESNQALSDANRQLFQVNTQLQQRTEDLQEANREIQETTRRKSDFLARMSHDLRTPMNAIIGYTRILLRRAREVLEERQYRNLENIETSSHNLLSLINETLDLSRIEAGRIDIKPTDVDLKQLLDECATSVESLVEPGVELQRDLGEVDAVYTDAEVLRRVVMNLLGNAVKFTEEGRIGLSLQAVDAWTEISVVDTGVGIPAEDLPHIFDEFQQVERQGSAEKEGTGLGLAIAKKSVELLGGTLSAESEVGKGTTFTLRIADYEA